MGRLAPTGVGCDGGAVADRLCRGRRVAVVMLWDLGHGPFGSCIGGQPAAYHRQTWVPIRA